MVGRVILRSGVRGLIWASAWSALMAPWSAEARCTYGGNTVFCVEPDGSSSTTIWSGNTTITRNSNGDFSTTTRNPGRSFSSGGNSYDGSSWFESTSSSGSHSFKTGIDRTGAPFTESRTHTGDTWLTNGMTDGKPWSTQERSVGNTTVWSGTDTSGNAWVLTQQSIGGGHVVLSGIRPDGTSWTSVPPASPGASDVGAMPTHAAPTPTNIGPLPASTYVCFIC